MFISSGRTKSRSTPGPSLFIEWTQYPVGFPKEIKTRVTVPTGGIQITESDGNRWPLPKGKDLDDHGSEFYSILKEWVRPTTKLPFSILNFKTYGVGTRRATLVGNPMIANCFGATAAPFANSAVGPYPGPYTNGDTHDAKLLKPNFPPDLSSTRAQLNVKGQIAVAQCAPSNQVAEAASAVAELLRDMPAIPGVSLWKSRLRAAETLVAGASEFLNGIFGVLPTISDVTEFYSAVHKVDKTVDQFVRDSGRVVRRKFFFPTERSETITDVSVEGGQYARSPVGYGSGDNNLYAASSLALPSYKTMRKRVIERETWFSGAFTYHVPAWYDTHDREDRMRLTAKLLGAEPDLNTLWQLAPWSWAVDWFVNAGTFIKSLQALISYGTILRYGYVMEKTTITDTFYAGDQVSFPTSPYSAAFSPPYPVIQPVTLRTTVKKRVKANPFGFGISWDGLSPVQQAIVAALGITRVAR